MHLYLRKLSLVTSTNICHVIQLNLNRKKDINGKINSLLLYGRNLCNKLIYTGEYMALYIHCGYSCVVVRELMMKNSTSNRHQLSEELIVEYNALFEGYPNMKPDGKPDYVPKECKELSSIFSQKWYPKDTAHSYSSTFSHEMWEKVSISLKLQHSQRECKPCPITFPTLTRAFPCEKGEHLVSDN